MWESKWGRSWWPTATDSLLGASELQTRNYAGVLPVLRRRNVVAEHEVAGVPCWETGAVLAWVIRSSASRGRRG